ELLGYISPFEFDILPNVDCSIEQFVLRDAFGKALCDIIPFWMIICRTQIDLWVGMCIYYIIWIASFCVITVYIQYNKKAVMCDAMLYPSFNFLMYGGMFCVQLV